MKCISFFLTLAIFSSNAIGRCVAELDNYERTAIAWCNEKENAPQCVAQIRENIAIERSVSDERLIQKYMNGRAGEDARNALRYAVNTDKKSLEELRHKLSSDTGAKQKVWHTANIANHEYEICKALYALGIMSTDNKKNISSRSGELVGGDQTQKNQEQRNRDPLFAQSKESSARAAETQAKADAQARRAGRRVHDPAAEASECIEPNFAPLYGGMRNKCAFKVHYIYCGSKPEEKSWLKGIMECERQKFGAGAVSPGREGATHTRHVERLYWFACKDPAWPVDHEFVPGQGIRGRCRNVGGN